MTDKPTLTILSGNTPDSPEAEMAKHEQMFQARPNVKPTLVPTDPQGFSIDTTSWNMGKYRVFFKALNQNNIEVINMMMIETLVKWPFELPISMEGFDELTPKEWASVAKAVAESTNRNFQ